MYHSYIIQAHFGTKTLYDSLGSAIYYSGSLSIMGVTQSQKHSLANSGSLRLIAC